LRWDFQYWLLGETFKYWLLALNWWLSK
jgi:hypothetical protein